MWHGIYTDTNGNITIIGCGYYNIVPAELKNINFSILGTIKMRNPTLSPYTAFITTIGKDGKIKETKQILDCEPFGAAKLKDNTLVIPISFGDLKDGWIATYALCFIMIKN